MINNPLSLSSSLAIKNNYWKILAGRKKTTDFYNVCRYFTSNQVLLRGKKTDIFFRVAK